jgi:four helix bundle protein
MALFFAEARMRAFRELVVWQKAHALTVNIYRVTKAFPRDERYGLVSQMRRAAASIGSNIAEGCGRGTPRDFARFVQVAIGSASELENQLLLASDLGFLSGTTYAELDTSVTDIKRMLTGLLRRLRADGRRLAADGSAARA